MFAIPGLDDIDAVASAHSLTGEQAYVRVHKARNEQIARAKRNPLLYGTEPAIWKVCDALLGFDWVDREWAERLRLRLGFEHPVSTLLINGGNRGSKSEYAAKRVMRVLQSSPNKSAWAMDQNNRRSIENQEPLYWKYMAPEWRKMNGVKSEVEYFKFTMKRGFTDGRFVLPNGSDGNFYSYQMDMEIIEGGNVDIINPDEMVASDWVETMKMRIAERHGRMIITFTPTNGYVDTVKMFQDGAEVVKESVAFLLPKDGGAPDPSRALGISEAHLARLDRFLRHPKKYDNPGVDSVAEECECWVDGKSEQPAVPEGREFEMMPRVMKCQDPEQAVVFFYSSDNPYGKPLSLWRKMEAASTEHIRERFYGFASKQQTAMFPRFNPQIHVVKPEDIPRQGTNYLIVDPCSGRNFFMAWIRATPEAAYIVEEWPSQVNGVPGIGVLGPWARASGKKMDGKIGPAQESLGWGLAQYKQEIARIEGWDVYRKWESGELECPEELSMNAWIAEWPEYGAAKMKIHERFMDARFMNVKSFNRDGMETLADEFDEIGLRFLATSAEAKQSVSEGVQMINTALWWNDEQPLSTLNCPKLYIGENCKNIIFALGNWTGRDGQKGACKDPVDVVRYFFLKKLEYIDKNFDAFVKGRGCY